MIEKIQPNLIPKNLKDQGVVVEKELSPEIIKKILEKVKDINSNGTAYTAIGRIPYSQSLESSYVDIESPYEIGAGKNLSKEILLRILKNGLSSNLKDSESSQEYKQKSIKNRNGVLFNIIGRSFRNSEKRQLQKDITPIKKISEEPVAFIDEFKYALKAGNNYMKGPGSMGLIFDLRRFKEGPPVDFDYGEHNNTPAKEEIKLNEFLSADFPVFEIWQKIKKEMNDPKLSIGDPKIKEYLNKHKEEYVSAYFTEDGLPIPSQTYGFLLYPRVAPREFQGITLDLYNEQSIGHTGAKSITEHEKIIEKTDNYQIKRAHEIRDGIWNEFHIILENKNLTDEEKKKIYLERDQKIEIKIKELVESENKQLINNVAKILKEAYPDRPDLLIPIYDIEGNLLWPVEIEYDKVKEFVENKEKKS